jgi:hypothetical protein
MSKPSSKTGQKFLAELTELENSGVAFHSEPKANILAIEDEIGKTSITQLTDLCGALESLRRRYHGVDLECRHDDPFDPTGTPLDLYELAVCPNPKCVMARLALEAVDD